MRPEDFFEIIDGIDDDIILDIPEINAEKPIKVVIENRQTPLRTVVLSAACLLCVLSIGVFIAAKLHNGLPVEPGPNGFSSTEDSSYESNSGSDSSDTSENSSNSSSSDRSDQNSSSEPQGVYIGNGMTLLGTPLDNSELEEFSIEPYIDNAFYLEADDEFLDSLAIPELKDIYKKASALFARLSTSEFKPAFAAVGNDRKRASIEEMKNDGLFAGEYYEWGYTYESFYNAFLSAFTEEAAEEIFKEYDFFLNYNGALFCKDTALGGNIWSGGAWEVRREYELISKSDTVIEFRRITFRDKDNKFNMEYIPERRDEYDIDYTGFKFVLTEDGWRAEFPKEY